MIKEILRQSWAEINLSALDHNVKQIKKYLGDECEIIGVVKADAYGHGVQESAKVLAINGVKSFGVATIEEAAELRDVGHEEEIVILGLTPKSCVDFIIDYRLTSVVETVEFAEVLAEAAARKGVRAPYILAVDTGMSRIGCRIISDEERAEAANQYERLLGIESLELKGLLTHFSSADEEDPAYTKWQLENFNLFIEELKRRGITDVKRIAANSAATILYDEARFEAVRPGMIMYGCYPSEYTRVDELELEPVMSVMAEIVSIRTIPAGTSVSYGRRFTSDKETRIATIPIGYADGYRRHLSGKAEVLIDGKRAPIVGSICMDQCMIDVSEIENCELGQRVVVMGKSGDDEISADELAGLYGTINYEVCCGFGARLPKVYTNYPRELQERED